MAFTVQSQGLNNLDFLRQERELVTLDALKCQTRLPSTVIRV